MLDLVVFIILREVNEAIIHGALYALVLVLSVGPTVFAILKYSISYGHKAGISYILGVFISDLLFVLLANLGANILATAQSYHKVIGICGAMVLIAMGLFGYFKKLTVQRNNEAPVPVGAFGYVKILINGFLVNTLNPGVILAWTTLTLNYSGESISYRGVLFTTTLAIAFVGDIIKVFAANKIRKQLTPRNIVYLQRTSAAILFLLGCFILIKTLFFTHGTSHH